jgi:hypothetical protein
MGTTTPLPWGHRHPHPGPRVSLSWGPCPGEVLPGVCDPAPRGTIAFPCPLGLAVPALSRSSPAAA